MPDATPRSPGSTLPMMAEVLGAANMPLPIPLSAISIANAQYGKSIGSSRRPTKLSPNSTMPVDAMPRAPNRSDSAPAAGPGDQESGRQREQEDAGPQRGVGVVVAVQRQPDALQPDDEHELQATLGERRRERGGVARAERPDLEQGQPDHRLGHPGLDEDERDEQHNAERRASRARTGCATRWCGRRAAVSPS